MTNQHPITPPIELVAQWFLGAKAMPVDQWVTDVATKAAQWGANQELEACCEWVDAGLRTPYVAIRLRSDRRSKPPSLKEQALAVLDDCSDRLDGAHKNIIRLALEVLPND